MSTKKKQLREKYITVESVSPAHPDKVMDTIAESLVDAYINKDPGARIAIDGAVKGKIMLCGEITSSASVDKKAVVKTALRELGYIKRQKGEESAQFNCEEVVLDEEFTEQSPDIAMGVDRFEDLLEKTSGDQGMMISGAVKESPNLISHSQEISKLLNKELFSLVVSGILDWGRQDIKTQVTVKYIDDVPKEITDVVVSISHEESKDLDELREEVKGIALGIITKYANENALIISENIKWFINATGKFSIYGPKSDSGLKVA